MGQTTIRDPPEHVEAELRRLAAERRLGLSRMASLLDTPRAPAEEWARRWLLQPGAKAWLPQEDTP
jgi:hypothetical protein